MRNVRASHPGLDTAVVFEGTSGLNGITLDEQTCGSGVCGVYGSVGCSGLWCVGRVWCVVRCVCVE